MVDCSAAVCSRDGPLLVAIERRTFATRLCGIRTPDPSPANNSPTQSDRIGVICCSVPSNLELDGVDITLFLLGIGCSPSWVKIFERAQALITLSLGGFTSRFPPGGLDPFGSRSTFSCREMIVRKFNPNYHYPADPRTGGLHVT